MLQFQDDVVLCHALEYLNLLNALFSLSIVCPFPRRKTILLHLLSLEVDTSADILHLIQENRVIVTSF